MARDRHKPEEIVVQLLQVDMTTAAGHSVADAVRPIGVTGATDHRWRSEHGDLGTARA